jgi:hypothetical protein
MSVPDPEQKEALRQLLRVAQTMDAELIDMTTWADRTTPCGTTACLLGHAAKDPWFMDHGWALHWNDRAGKAHVIYEGCVAYEEDRDLFFGLSNLPPVEGTSEETDWDSFLFMPGQYRHTHGPRLKAEVIEHVKHACEVADAIPLGTEV